MDSSPFSEVTPDMMKINSQRWVGGGPNLIPVFKLELAWAYAYWHISSSQWGFASEAPLSPDGPFGL